MVALYVASHYKNSPNDLQLMSDAPAHELYILAAPATNNKLPEPLCVIQVALEGKISRQSVLNQLSRGSRPSGDLIPWLVSQQYQDEDFASLSGARIVRIATNPDYIGMGYGKRALQLLVDFYEGKFTNLSEGDAVMEETYTRATDAELADATLLDDDVKVKDINQMPTLFAKLDEKKPAALDYIGVSYGMSPELLRFWKKAQFAPVCTSSKPDSLVYHANTPRSCTSARRPASSPASTRASWSSPWRWAPTSRGWVPSRATFRSGS